MKIFLTEEEAKAMERIAKMNAFMNYLDKWLISLRDCTAIEDYSKAEIALRVRKMTIEEITEKLIEPLKRLSGKLEPSSSDEFR